MGAPVYRGKFDVPQAERLLWRAGFGPRPGEAEALAKLGLDGAVHSLLNPGAREARRPEAARLERAARSRRADAWGHDHCWWLDRMVRTSRPLVERMTLVWHDWFATSNDGVGDQGLMLEQNDLFRNHGLGSFERLLLDVTANPAMLVWLNGTENRRTRRTRTTAREMMELFTLGADRGAYTERDVREQARSLTGLDEPLEPAQGRVRLPLRREAARPRHEDGVPQARPLRLARRLPALPQQPEAPVVLRAEAVELLRPGRARRARR